jgi:hypothetical protein
LLERAFGSARRAAGADDAARQINISQVDLSVLTQLMPSARCRSRARFTIADAPAGTECVLARALLTMLGR